MAVNLSQHGELSVRLMATDVTLLLRTGYDAASNKEHNWVKRVASSEQMPAFGNAAQEERMRKWSARGVAKAILDLKHSEHKLPPLPAQCGWCGALSPDPHGLKHCGGCMTVLYCGTDCAKAHWRRGHRAECHAKTAAAAAESAAAA